MTSYEVAQETGGTNKHYSFLDVLDNIATSSGSLTFAPAFIPATSMQARKEDAVKRLSETLQTLTSNQYGYKHLPELPIPDYDNGNVGTISTSCSNAGPKPVLVQTSFNAPGLHVQEARGGVQRAQHLPLASLGQTPDSNIFAEMTQFQGQNFDNSFLSSCQSSDSARNRTSHLSSQKSSPTSLHRSPTTRHAPVCIRPESSESNTRSSCSRNKSITFNDQRACRPSSQQSPKQSFTTGTQIPRRCLRFVASFKDLIVKSEKRPKIGDTRRMSTTETQMPLMSLREALQGVAPLSPLHDSNQDQKFTQECLQLLSLRKKASKCSFIEPRKVKQLPETPHGLLHSGVATDIRPSIHEHRASKAMSISTSILDWSWPQPSTYTSLDRETAHDIQHARQDSVTIPPFTCDDSLPKMWTAPAVEKVAVKFPPRSAPPECPLPRLPLNEVHVNAAPTFYNSRADHHQAVDTSSQLETTSHAQNLKSASSRLPRLAARRGLAVDANIAIYDNANVHDEVQLPPKLPLSPLKVRYNKSNRNSKVNELKRRHLSMLEDDGVDFLADAPHGSNAANFAKRGSAPDAIHIGITTTNDRRRLVHELPVSVDKFKPLPLTPSSRFQSRKMSALSVAERQGTPSSTRNASGTGRRYKAKSRQLLVPAATASERLQTLSQSNVMTVVDSDPRLAHGFCAGRLSFTPTKTRQQTQPKSGGTPCRETLDTGSSKDSRPSSSQSVMSWTTTPSSTTTSIDVSSKPDSGCTADPALHASLDSGYGSSHDATPRRSQKSAYISKCIKSGSLTSDKPGTNDQLTFMPSNIHNASFSPEERVGDLKDEIDRTKRVYNAMVRANQSLRQEYRSNKKYTKLLEEDRKARALSPEIWASTVLAKIEADLTSTPPKADSDSERTITPSLTQKSVQISVSDRVGESRDRVTKSVLPSSSDTSAPLGMPSNSFAASSMSPSITNTTIESSGQLPLTAGSTLLSANRYQPQSVVSRAGTPTTHSKRYSMLSKYNLHSSRQLSRSLSHTVSTTSVRSTAPTHHVPRRLPHKQVAVGSNMPAIDIYQELDLDNVVGDGSDKIMPLFLVSTRQMDRAIDALQSSG